ncbi:Neuropeptide-Like Protein [Caenorhabditis elegans]|uniref:Neuropeptide-Like Protein n=1 Tax=Caenorhabditis elegans TaxID=6239 RepID=Q93745_CAEEL|nr:Neuropeptide-Like Protein [Caenorhabditis elegans]CAB02552.1 Neuropeptide-Like Protein [Caenorhabditis elegans]|eukprot:NP_510187.1 Neuropeptide-Like Protein [Caenorhabditis elegans]
MSKIVACLVLLALSVMCVYSAPYEFRAKRAINPFLDSMGKRAVNPFLDSIGKRSFRPDMITEEKRYFDSLAGQSLGKRSNNRYEMLENYY